MTGPEGLRPGDPRQIIETIVVREVPFPEDPQARFEAIFAAIGNSQTKCITLLMLGSFPKTSSDLHHEFLRTTNRVWETNSQLQATWTRQSLVNVGLVAEADTLFYGSSEFVTGFRATQAGITYGQPIAAFLLEKSLGLPFSINKLGITSKSHEERPVVSRVRILEYLAQMEGQSTYTSGVAEALDLEQNTTGRHLAKLASLGLAVYSSVDPERKGEIRFTVADGKSLEDIKTVAKMPVLSQIVGRIVFDLGTLDKFTVLEEIKRRYPDRKTTTEDVRKILTGFAKIGLLKRRFGEPSRGEANVNSRADITETGRAFIEGIIKPIRHALTPEGETLLRQWRQIPWQNYAQKAAEAHKSTSGNANWRSTQESASDVLQLIIENPGIRPIELDQTFGRNTSGFLLILIREGVVTRTRHGRSSRYFPT